MCCCKHQHNYAMVVYLYFKDEFLHFSPHSILLSEFYPDNDIEGHFDTQHLP